jgi:dipeptidyl-peptidase-4
VQYAQTDRFRLGRPQKVTVLPGGEVLFLRTGARSFVADLYRMDPVTGRVEVLVRAAALVGKGRDRMSEAEKAQRERRRLSARGISQFSVSRDGRRVLLGAGGQVFVLWRREGRLQRLVEGAVDASFSPDGRRVAYVRDGNLFVVELESGVQRQLTWREGADVEWGAAEFVAQEEMGRFEGYWWSPEGDRLVVQRTDVKQVGRLALPDVAHPERVVRQVAYPRPGEANADVTLAVLSVGGAKVVWLRWDRQRFPYLATVKWRKGSPLTLVVQNRLQTEEQVLVADPVGGGTRRVLEERDAAWINLYQRVPWWLEDGSGFLWLSERSGQLSLELRGAGGELVRTIAGAEVGLQGLAGVDEKAGVVYVLGSAEPTEQHVWRVRLDGAGRERLTSAPGVHEVALAEDGSGMVIGGRSLGGSESVLLARGRRWRLPSVAEVPVVAPQVEFTRVESGGRWFSAALVRPRDFAAGRRYPVLVHVYGGPGHLMVRKDRGEQALRQWFADRGYVVVAIDGRGTPGRGRGWERAIKGDLVSVPLADQAAALRALGARYRELDLERVGIFGWSFGGYLSAMAVLLVPELFRAAVVGAGPSDWGFYDTHYTERYLGLPAGNRRGYAHSSVLTHAARLRRPMLVIHGTADDNVFPLHAYRLVDALQRAEREVSFWPLVGHTHKLVDPRAVVRTYRHMGHFFDRVLRAGAGDTVAAGTSAAQGAGSPGL